MPPDRQPGQNDKSGEWGRGSGNHLSNLRQSQRDVRPEGTGQQAGDPSLQHRSLRPSQLEGGKRLSSSFEESPRQLGGFIEA